MGIKEKVLKAIDETLTSGVLEEDDTIIDLTLAEVEKVIDNKLDSLKERWCESGVNTVEKRTLNKQIEILKEIKVLIGGK